MGTLIVGPREGHVSCVLGDNIHLRLEGTQTGGKLAMGLSKVWPEGGPPPHIHHREDEMFVVLEGQFTFMLEDTITPPMGPGFAIYLPQGRVHQFKKVGPGPGKFLVTTVPDGFDRFVRECGQPSVVDPQSMSAVTPEAIGKVMELCPKYGIEMRPEARATRTVTPGTFKRYWVLGNLVTLQLTSRETSGNFCVAEGKVWPGHGVPPHVHPASDEVFHIIEGELEFMVGQQKQRCAAGTTIWAPRGTRHAFTNISSTPARFQNFHTPGGFERFFTEMGTEALDVSAPPKSIDMARVKEMAPKYGMEL